VELRVKENLGLSQSNHWYSRKAMSENRTHILEKVLKENIVREGGSKTCAGAQSLKNKRTGILENSD